MSTSTKIKRGGFVKDTRTGQVVRVAETGGRDLLVKPAYKTDGYWVSASDLEAASDPHAWGWKQLLLQLLVLAGVVFLGHQIFADLRAHGFAFWEALIYTSSPTAVMLFILNTGFKLNPI